MRFILMALFAVASLHASVPEGMQGMMDQPKYRHSLWGLYVKDLMTGEVLFDLNSNLLFSPASTTKLFSVAALLKAYGDEFRFKTPVFPMGKIENGRLLGDLVLVGQGDLTLGGREGVPGQISFTKMDHLLANSVPGAILTKEDPLNGLKDLAKQIAHKGIKEIDGDVRIDESFFEAITLRGMSVSPIMVNENLIDLTINPGSVGQAAKVTFRPVIPGYTVSSQVKTAWEETAIDVAQDASNPHNIVLKGTVKPNQKDVIRTFAIQDPKGAVRAAFIQALQNQGIKINIPKKLAPLPSSYKNLQPLAVWTSPPLTEYAKLILKVSHNLGADLIPLLLAAKAGKKTFKEGMRLLGEFVIDEVQIPSDAFVFVDAAGSNDNRVTPQAQVQLLEYIHRQSSEQFYHFFEALPILGVDGSLEDFAKKVEGAGKVRAKPGTGLTFSDATGKYFLVTQALAGYIEGKNGHLFAYMLVVNNGNTPTIEDVFGTFEDFGQLSNLIYLQTDIKK